MKKGRKNESRNKARKQRINKERMIGARTEERMEVERMEGRNEGMKE